MHFNLKGSPIRVLSVLLVGILAGVGLASAGTVYIPLALEAPIRGVDYETELVVTNPSFLEGSFTVYFIPAFTDGADRPDDFEPDFEETVPPGSTRIFRGLVRAPDKAGMAEIVADDQLIFSANLVPSQGSVEQLGGQVPVITSDNIVRAGARFHIQGWFRDATQQTDLTVTNLSQERNECAVDVLQPGGAPVGSRVFLNMAPLSTSFFPDALVSVGVRSAADYRVQIRCGGPSFAFSQVIDTATTAIKTLTLSAQGDSALIPPGTVEPCPTLAFCWDVPGIFHTPAPGSDTWTREIPVPNELIYRKVRVQMTFQFNGWYGRDPSGLHGLFWLYRNNTWRGNTFGYVNLRGPNKNLFTNLTNVNLPGGDTRRTTTTISLNQGQTYLVDYEYDTENRLVSTVLRTAGGVALAGMVDVPPSTKVPTQSGFKIQVGLHREFIEVPSYGWVYSNLRVTFTP